MRVHFPPFSFVKNMRQQKAPRLMSETDISTNIYLNLLRSFTICRMFELHQLAEEMQLLKPVFDTLSEVFNNEFVVNRVPPRKTALYNAARCYARACRYIDLMLRRMSSYDRAKNIPEMPVTYTQFRERLSVSEQRTSRLARMMMSEKASSPTLKT